MCQMIELLRSLLLVEELKQLQALALGVTPQDHIESVFGQRIREILGFGGVSIDDPREDYTPFYCPVHEASRFRGPATIKGADIRAGFYVGMSQEKAKIDFHYADTEPEKIEIGGGNFISGDTLVGAEAGVQHGIVFILSERDITGFIDHGLSWFEGIRRTFDRVLTTVPSSHIQRGVPPLGL